MYLGCHGLSEKDFACIRTNDQMPFEQDGNVYCRKFGSRREVLDGVAFCTSGKLTADRLEERGGKIISRKRSELGYSKKFGTSPDT